MADEWIVSYDDIGSEIVHGQIVRCKECMHWDKDNQDLYGWAECFEDEKYWHGNNYCSWGERRADE